ncbi:MAG: hypothetical protein NC320_11705 [Clostridium sp.]|nr:hypothetical protein [Clostridium sp.]
MSTTKNNKVKEVTIDMPIAIALMIILGNKELRKNYINVECKERLSMVLEPLVSDIDRLSEDIFRNNNIHLVSKDDVYQKLYENRKQYHFDNLIAYLRFFYTNEISFSQINGYEDIKRCYQVIEKHQTKTANTRFTSDFCWKIASFF